MEEKEVIFTQEEYKKLEEQLAYLKGPRKMEVAEKIKAAREYGDLSENSEYDEAKNEQALLDSKIEEVEALVRNAKVIDNISTKTISVGVSVKLFDYEFDEEVTYHIVASTEIAPLQYRISLDSPIGKALFGRKKGEEVTVELPDGTAKYKILEISKT